MRVAHVNQDPGISPARKKGAAVHLDAMRRAFAELGAEVLAIDVADPGGVHEALRQATEGQPLDLIYERYAIGSGAAFEFARSAGTPFVLEVNSPLEAEALRYRGVSVAGEGSCADLRRAMFTEAHSVLAVSSAVADYARANGASSRNLHVQPNGVDLERFRPRVEGDALREQLVPAGAFALGFHGRVRPWHNVPMLVSAAGKLIEEGVQLHLLLIGEGGFEELVADHLPAGAFSIERWLPHDEVGRYVACFDALVMTHSAQAPFYFSPLKLYEAMAAGVPPVVPALGDLPRLLNHRQDALLFEPDDEPGLMDAIRELAADSSLHGRLAAEGRRLAARSSWRDIARDVLARGRGART